MEYRGGRDGAPGVLVEGSSLSCFRRAPRSRPTVGSKQPVWRSYWTGMSVSSRQRHASPVAGTSSDFRQRCASALTHPATVAALAVLVLNDLVFKAVWPGSWATGKLSDLAWVVFASPLLAFFLSFLVGQERLRQRVAFLGAYVGLPLLYAAFNTFTPVHNLILRGLSIASGGTAGSPLDATDSLVVPFGLGIAVWVWHRRVASTESLRHRWTLLMAGVAVLASVATSVEPPSPTEWLAGVSSDKTLIVEGSQKYYKSNDGGITWTAASQDQGEDVEWGGTRVGTPRGTYVIEGADINLLAPGGESKKVYSVDFLREDVNVWAQKYSTKRLRSNLTDLYGDPQELVVTEPINMVYDERSSNVIVAMGVQGVLVGDSDETWRRVAVGDFAPTDFSFLAKARLMLSLHFWLGMLTFSLAFLVGALALSQKGQSLPAIRVAGSAAVYRRMTGILLLLIVLTLLFGLFSGTLLPYLISTNALTFLLVLLSIALVAFAWAWSGQSNVRKVIAFVPAVLGALLSMSSFPPYGGDVGAIYLHLDSLFASAGLMFAIVALAIYPPRRRQVTALAVALVSMNASIILPFVLWLTGGLALIVASAASVALLTLTAYALRRHLTRQVPSLEA